MLRQPRSRTDEGAALCHSVPFTAFPLTWKTLGILGPFLVAYQNLPGRCLVYKHGSHVINILKADWSSMKNKQLTATPC